jgi:hypothetical protein
MRKLGIPFSLLCVFAMLVIGCGSKQSGSSSPAESCQSIGEGITSEGWDRWARCTRAQGAAADDASCATALRWAQSATPNALAAATACVLRSENRSNITYIADGLQDVAFSDEKVIAIAGGLTDHFSERKHGNILAGALTESAQIALGRVLPQLDETTAHVLFRFALRHNLTYLAASFDDYEHAQKFRAELDDEMILQFAQQVKSDHTLSETERWALAESGVWSAHDIVRCQSEQLRGCDGWEGDQPLKLLDESENRGENARTPGMIADAITRDGVTREEVGAGLRWLSSSENSNAIAHLRTTINNMTNPSRSDDFRYGVAVAATGAICTPSLVVNASRRAVSDDDQTATSVWNTFLQQCLSEQWSWQDILYVLSIGSDLHAHEDVYTAIVEASAPALDGVACEGIESISQRIYEETQAYDRPMTGLVFGHAGAGRPDCVPALNDELTRVAGNAEQHPEARYLAIEVLANSGDLSMCSALGSVSEWSPGEDEPGMTELANDYRTSAANACN